ncbi:MAG: hypothetical protein CSB24_03475 [Deltaproteobacteria bacterium]|nr:MAG: hypothetical protein CSB24_03475 [Deltaproteobacteria bacterium]
MFIHLGKIFTPLLKMFILSSVLPLLFCGCTDGWAKDKQLVRVVKVIDGDSVLAVEPASDKKIEIRLWGIDAPEWNQPYSKKARKYLASKVLGKKIVLGEKGYDRYHRLLAILYDAGSRQSINHLLVENGMAWVYTKYCQEKICRSWTSSESKARKKGLGLWRDKSPIAPWKWRRAKHNRKKR